MSCFLVILCHNYLLFDDLCVARPFRQIDEPDISLKPYSWFFEFSLECVKCQCFLFFKHSSPGHYHEIFLSSFLTLTGTIE